MEPNDPPAAPGRQRRADASRNTARLLTAAREVLAESGPELVLDEVARRAGVGNATLYRHFPTRADLLAAVYADEVEALRQRGEDLLDHPSAAEALFSWLAEFAVHVATKRTLAIAATEPAPERRTALYDQWHRTMTATATGLLARARAAGAVDPELTASDLLTLASGVALAATDPERVRRLVAVLRTGVAAR